MKYKAHCKQCRNRSKIQEKNRRDKIDILQTHHRSLPWIGTEHVTPNLDLYSCHISNNRDRCHMYNILVL